MAINHKNSCLFEQLVSPVKTALSTLNSVRKCPQLSDSSWIMAALLRALSSENSTRGFLQDLLMSDIALLPLSRFFKSLHSLRRYTMLKELNHIVTKTLNQDLPDRLRMYPQLEGYQVFAGDGHFHACSTHERPKKDRKYAVSHLYRLNLRTHMLSHLCIGDSSKKKAHDMSGLKSLSVSQLRSEACTGEKVIYVWDRAGIDSYAWYQWKQKGIYFVSRAKKNFSLNPTGKDTCHHNDPINKGVIYDRFSSVGGIMIRHIRYQCPDSGKSFDFVTNLNHKIPAGIVVQLYQMRWDIEKVFDEIKNKLHEKKAWGRSDCAKQTQAQIICLLHNLLEKLQVDTLNEHVVDVKEEKRRNHRYDQSFREEHIKFWRLENASQLSIKFIRWVRGRLWIESSWKQNCYALAALYQLF